VSDKVRIGIVGTSWWADAMYLPALTRHPLADVRGVAGGTRPEHTREFAARWGVPGAYDSLDDMLAAEPLDALVILSPNVHHFPYAMAAIERGLHVLCEKPLALSSTQARQMAEAAERAGVVTMVPFTYRFMPVNRYLKELVDEGYIGRPYHLNLRYYTGYGRSGDYSWRFDLDQAGSGVTGDLGSHWAYLARWFYGEIAAVTAVFSHAVPRAARPDGVTFTAAEDSAMILLEFENGATGSLHVSSLAHEPGPFGQRHAMELHGSGGTLHAFMDWDRVQRVDGCRADEPATHELPIPDRLFGNARRDTVGNTYKDTFRLADNMARGFVTAIAEGTPASPDFRDGLAVQRVLDAASLSSREGRRVTTAEIVANEG
jgi:predicted dehydrogenase